MFGGDSICLFSLYLYGDVDPLCFISLYLYGDADSICFPCQNQYPQTAHELHQQLQSLWLSYIVSFPWLPTLHSICSLSPRPTPVHTLMNLYMAIQPLKVQPERWTHSHGDQHFYKQAGNTGNVELARRCGGRCFRVAPACCKDRVMYGLKKKVKKNE